MHFKIIPLVLRASPMVYNLAIVTVRKMRTVTIGDRFVTGSSPR